MSNSINKKGGAFYVPLSYPLFNIVLTDVSDEEEQKKKKQIKKNKLVSPQFPRENTHQQYSEIPMPNSWTKPATTTTTRPFAPTATTTRPFAPTATTTRPFAPTATTTRPFAPTATTTRPFAPNSQNIRSKFGANGTPTSQQNNDLQQQRRNNSSLSATITNSVYGV
jgi:hypothetical protein